MTEEQWREAWQILEESADLTPEARRSLLLAKGLEPGVLAQLLAIGESGDPSGETTDARPRSTAPGDRIGKYEILAPLGRGGMGEIWAARDVELQRTIALKFLPSDRIDGRAREQFLREARAASALNHPNIVTVHEVVSHEATPVIVMELIEGASLREIAGAPRPVQEVAEIGVQVARALAAAHAAGIVHRDIKPENIMVRPDGYVKVLDFGLARHFTGGGIASSVGMLTGTLRYLSPEQARGEPVDGASDIFSLGIVLYELAMGRHPFGDGLPLRTAHEIASGTPRPLSPSDPPIPVGLKSLLFAMLEKQPGSRPPAREVTETLGRLLHDTAETARREEPGRVRRKAVWPAALAGVMAAAALVAWLVQPRKATILEAAPFTSESGVVVEPAFSPDGSAVAYVWNGPKEDNFDIYVKPLGEGEAVRLTRGAEQNYSPSWSPDGRTIAFLSYSGINRAQVRLVSRSGGPEKVVAEIVTPQWGQWWFPGPFLRWSQDARRLIVSTKRSPSAAVPFGLYALSVDSGELRPLTEGAGFGDSGPALSPDGRNLAFTRLIAEGSSSLYVMGVSPSLEPEGPARQVQTGRPWNTSPAWTADSKAVVFSTGTQYNNRLARISPWSGDPQPLAGVGEAGCYPVVSKGRDGGASLAYVKHIKTTAIWRLALQHHGKAAPAAKEPPVRVTSPTSHSRLASWSKDGDRFAYVSARSGYPEVWVANQDGSNTMQWSSLESGEVADPRWSPDGKRILFRAVVNGKVHLYVTSGPGTQAALLRPEPAYGGAWSHDGQWIYYTTPDGSDIWKAPVRGGAPSRVSEESGYNLQISPAGEALYFARIRDAEVWTWRLALDARSVADRVAKPQIRMADSFSVGRNGVYFVPVKSTSIEESDSFGYFDFKTGSVSLIARVGAGIQYQISVSEDERFLLYARNEFEATNIMTVRGFR